MAEYTISGQPKIKIVLTIAEVRFLRGVCQNKLGSLTEEEDATRLELFETFRDALMNCGSGE